jgi:hypothetical protein
MSNVFGRSWRLEIGSIKIESISKGDGSIGPESLRVTFSIEREKTHDPNKAEFAIYNLSPDHRRDLANGELTVRFMAGYGSALDLMFFGVLRGSGSQDDESGNKITTVTAGDGDSKIVNSRVAKSFAKGTLIRNVVQALVDNMGIKPGNLSTFSPLFSLGGPTLSRPIALHGVTSEVLADFCRSIGYEYCVIDDALQIRPTGMPAGTGPLLSASTGLVGSPQRDQKSKVTFQCRLMPGVLPGLAVTLASAHVSGVALLEKTRHYGDTHGADWTIDAEGTLK